MKKFILLFIYMLMVTAGFAQLGSDLTGFNKSKLEWRQEARFGMFIHWRPFTLMGGEIGWARQGYGKAQRIWPMAEAQSQFSLQQQRKTLYTSTRIGKQLPCQDALPSNFLVKPQ